ncbi:chaplin [Streptomyces beijiangensis]|uniref:Chaplin n=1 Tax=Streptomyces beijiangensis TaxID=163361 RepID=A0A939FCM3_9ACTN|nr:chaplin [Streptomyces beijiangensis]MBO0515573.1 chaplin [Streptomyces beijiangensis]
MSHVVKSAGLAFAVGAVVLAGASAACADSGAEGVAYGSPGVLSGNVVQVPVHVPVNACGNTVSVIGLLNPAFGNSCSNSSHGDWHQGGWEMQGDGMNHWDGHQG